MLSTTLPPPLAAVCDIQNLLKQVCNGPESAEADITAFPNNSANGTAGETTYPVSKVDSGDSCGPETA